jgi:hypothetical protein
MAKIEQLDKLNDPEWSKDLGIKEVAEEINCNSCRLKRGLFYMGPWVSCTGRNTAGEAEITAAWPLPFPAAWNSVLLKASCEPET